VLAPVLTVCSTGVVSRVWIPSTAPSRLVRYLCRSAGLSQSAWATRFTGPVVLITAASSACPAIALATWSSRDGATDSHSSAVIATPYSAGATSTSKNTAPMSRRSASRRATVACENPVAAASSW
jgi:hypothetical protein